MLIFYLEIGIKGSFLLNMDTDQLLSTYSSRNKGKIPVTSARKHRMEGVTMSNDAELYFPGRYRVYSSFR